MKYDVIICGAGPSGMAAAISARRNQAKVLLLESSGLLGGSTVLSLVSPWMTFHNDGKQIIKGIGEEIVSRLKNRGESFGHIADPIGFTDSITPIDIEGVKQLFFDYVSEEGIDLLLHAFVCEVRKDKNTIKGVRVATKSGFLDIDADVVVDATGDGDVCHLMGCETVFGRTEDHQAQPMTMLFSVDGVDTDQLRDFLKANADDCVIAKDYDFQYLAVSGFFKKVEEAKANGDFDLIRDRVLMFQDIRAHQVGINMTRVTGRSGINVSDLTKAEIAGRKQIQKAFQFFKKYIPGFQNSYILRTPVQIGIRETRHVIGEYVLTAEDILSQKEFEDSICLSGFPIDIHSPNGAELKFFDQKADKGYEIPLRILIPKNSENLIVTGRCVSATHEACASLRVTPSVMALGEAAGVLAALAAQKKTSPRQVDYREVQSVLRAQGQLIKKADIKKRF